ncbi:MAG: hypothetical protein RLZZ399_2660 [Verrucomicrobiota bacterium]|jgi:plastocyanin
MKPLRHLLLPSFLACLASPLLAAEPVSLTLKTLTAQMKFDMAELTVSPGSKVKLTFENPDDMPHNVVFCTPGTDVEQLVLKMLEKPEEAMKRGFLPDDPRVWLKSKLLNPQEKEVIEFTAPEKPGLYPYVCSFPGHALSMKGVLRVLGEGPKLQDLQFALYHGSWTKLPDFSKLTPHRTGDVPDNLIQLNFDDYKNQYGLVFTGKLKVPTTGEYVFSIASDDGSRLFIDDVAVVTDDGIHPARIRESSSKKLEKGVHTVRLEYFQADAASQLFLAWRGSNKSVPLFDTTALSKWTPDNWKSPIAQKKDEFTGLPLEPKDAPIIYRNFIAGAGNRAIGVGFPGGLSFAWSAESMNFALAWRGAFMDAARHWKNRGGGHQPPAGFDVASPTTLTGNRAVPPLAVLETPQSAWPEPAPGEIAEGYLWKGYKLDAKGVPTFSYRWKDVEVEDRVDAHGSFKEASAKLVRTLKLNGAIPAKTFLILGRGASYTATPGGFAVHTAQSPTPLYFIHAEGATLSEGRLIVPARKEIQVSYSWPAAALHPQHAAK